MTLMDKRMQSEEKRTTDILKEVEDSIAMGNKPKARSILRRFVEFEKALGKTVVKGGITVAKRLAEERRQREMGEGEPTQPTFQLPVSPTVLQVQTQDPKIQIDNIVNRLEQLKGVI